MVRENPVRSSPEWQRRSRPIFAAALSLLALGALATGSAAQQQTGQIAGQVTDAQTGGPLPEVQVYITTLSIGNLTRANGRFAMLNVPAGTYEVRAQRIGYSTASQSVTVTAGGTVEAN